MRRKQQEKTCAVYSEGDLGNKTIRKCFTNLELVIITLLMMKAQVDHPLKMTKNEEID